jgi:proline iminopeptidase
MPGVHRRRPWTFALSFTAAVAFTAFAAFAACTGARRAQHPANNHSQRVSTTSTGEARLAVDGGRIWYRKSGVGSATPVILLHGGPGLSSFYLKPLEALGNDRVVIRYDQLGGGKSDPLTDTTKMTIAHFVAELDSLRSALGYEHVHLVGHSWGAVLAYEYDRSHPEHVASLTLASPALDIPSWTRHAWRLVATLSDSAQRAIHSGEDSAKFDSPDYRRAMQEFNARYISRRPPAAELDSTMSMVGESVSNYMHGPANFAITGSLKSYDVTSRLRTIAVPTLYMVGEYDEADPAMMKRFASLTPGAHLVVIPGAAHITTWDNPTAMVDAVRSFLRQADGAVRR